MRLLLDTHAFLWAVREPRRIPAPTYELLHDTGNDLTLSVATVWEMAIKVRLGKLRLDAPIEAFVERQVQDLLLDILPVNLHHALRVASLPAFADHRDPFDRMLAAQALVEGVPLVSADAKFERYGLHLIW